MPPDALIFSSKCTQMRLAACRVITLCEKKFAFNWAWPGSCDAISKFWNVYIVRERIYYALQILSAGFSCQLSTLRRPRTQVTRMPRTQVLTTYPVEEELKEGKQPICNQKVYSITLCISLAVSKVCNNFTVNSVGRSGSCKYLSMPTCALALFTDANCWDFSVAVISVVS